MKIVRKITTAAITAALVIIAFPSAAQTKWEKLPFKLSPGVLAFYNDTTDGRLYIGGDFREVEGKGANGLIWYDGRNWDTLLTPLIGFDISAITRYKGELYVAGGYGLAKYDGNTWTILGDWVGNTFNFLEVIDDTLYVAGLFDSIAGIQANGAARFDGTKWEDLTKSLPIQRYSDLWIFDICKYKNQLYLAGNFDFPNGLEEVMRWDGTEWKDVGGGLKGGDSLNTIIAYQDEIYIGGWFYEEGGQNPGRFMQRWDGERWKSVGMGV
ncbi:MAG: hypothetical protein WD077_10875 [Bacteroidia bacterium]